MQETLKSNQNTCVPGRNFVSKLGLSSWCLLSSLRRGRSLSGSAFFTPYMREPPTEMCCQINILTDALHATPSFLTSFPRNFARSLTAAWVFYSYRFLRGQNMLYAIPMCTDTLMYHPGSQTDSMTHHLLTSLPQRLRASAARACGMWRVV